MNGLLAHKVLYLAYYKSAVVSQLLLSDAHSRIVFSLCTKAGPTNRFSYEEEKLCDKSQLPHDEHGLTLLFRRRLREGKGCISLHLS